MKTFVISRLPLFLLVLGVSVTLARAEAKKVDFDQGIDAQAVLEDARNGGQLNDPAAVNVSSKQPKLCTVNFKSNKITLEPGINYARAEYKLDENCQPVLTSVVYLSSIPKEAKIRLNHGRDGRSADSTFTGKLRSAAKSSSATCAIHVWEKDVINATMITLDNGTAWENDGGQIVGGNVHGNIFGNLDWWFVDGPPAVNIGYVQEPFTARSSVVGGYYCDTVGPVSNYVCHGPSFRIQLQGDIFFDGGGNCSGQYGWSGTKVPLGSVTAEVTR